MKNPMYNLAETTDKSTTMSKDDNSESRFRGKEENDSKRKKNPISRNEVKSAEFRDREDEHGQYKISIKENTEIWGIQGREKEELSQEMKKRKRLSQRV